MNNKEHKNLVQGRDVPQEIVDALRSPEKLLGLEYCDSDLRKVKYAWINIFNVSHETACQMCPHSTIRISQYLFIFLL